MSSLGAQASHLALLYWLKDVAGSGTVLGLFMTCSALPAILLGPLAGVLADRFSRRVIAASADALSAAALLGLAFLVWSGSSSAAWAFAVGIAVSAFRSTFEPAYGALMADLIPPDAIARTQSLRSSVGQAVSFAGQSLAGVLLRILGAPLAFLVDGLSYLYASLCTLLVREPRRSCGSEKRSLDSATSFLSDFHGGVAYLAKEKGLRAVLALTVVLNAAVAPVAVWFPFLVDDWLKVGPEWMGWLGAASSVGALAGALAGGRLSGSQGIFQQGGAAFLVLGVAISQIGCFRIPWVPLLCMALVGAGAGFVNVVFSASMQRRVPAELRGRVGGLAMMLNAVAAPVSMAAGGIFLDLLSRRMDILFGVSGVMVVLSVCVLYFRRAMREFLTQ